jgi:hypothetical protein
LERRSDSGGSETEAECDFERQTQARAERTAWPSPGRTAC